MEKKKITLKEIGPAKLVLILLCGVVLLLLPTSDKENEKDDSLPDITQGDDREGSETQSGNAMDGVMDIDEYVKQMEERIEKQLALVEGVGNVKVMITLESTSEKIVLKDENVSKETIKEEDAQGGTRDNESMTTSDESVLVGDGSSYPYTLKENMPYIQGVAVVAQGGGDAKVKQEIIEAIQVLFGVPIHNIKVMKMASE